MTGAEAELFRPTTKNRKRAGTKRELQVRDLKRAEGYIAFRTPASLGVCDVIAMRAYANWPDEHGDLKPLTHVEMIEVKANKHGGPFDHFRPPERRALLEAAEQAGALAILCYWPPNRMPRWIPSSEWPSPSA